jgi:hypothetical protein
MVNVVVHEIFAIKCTYAVYACTRGVENRNNTIFKDIDLHTIVVLESTLTGQNKIISSGCRCSAQMTFTYISAGTIKKNHEEVSFVLFGHTKEAYRYVYTASFIKPGKLHTANWYG